MHRADRQRTARPARTPGRRLLRHLALLLTLALSAPAALGVYDGIEERGATGDKALEEPWREAEVRLPSYPREADLVRVPQALLGPGFQVAIDRRSLARGRDGVIRYTVVLSNSAGAHNVFYEGLRCTPQTARVYAFGDRGGRLRPYPRSRWREYDGHGVYGYRDTLRRYFFCEKGVIARRIKVILARLRRWQLPGGMAEERDVPVFSGGTER